MSSAVDPRRNAVRCAKRSRHVALVGEADLSGDLGTGNIGATEHIGSPIDAAPTKQFTGRAAPCRAENAGQVNRMNTDLRSDISDVQAPFGCPIHNRFVGA